MVKRDQYTAVKRKDTKVHFAGRHYLSFYLLFSAFPTAICPPLHPYTHTRTHMDTLVFTHTGFLHFSGLVPLAVCLSVCMELVGWAGSWEVWWSVSSVDVDGPWSEARAWLLKRSLFCASEPALPVLFHPCR